MIETADGIYRDEEGYKYAIFFHKGKIYRHLYIIKTLNNIWIAKEQYGKPARLVTQDFALVEKDLIKRIRNIDLPKRIGIKIYTLGADKL